MEDAEILALFWARDSSAITEAEAKYGRYLSSIAGRVLTSPEDCDECVNDAYLAAWNAIPPHRPEKLATFLGKLTRRIAVDRYRRENSQRRKCPTVELALSELSECIPAKDPAEETVERLALSQAVNRFLEGLKPQTRRIFVCRYFYNMTTKEVAKACGCSQSKVKSALLRARGKLREQLEKEGISI